MLRAGMTGGLVDEPAGPPPEPRTEAVPRWTNRARNPGRETNGDGFTRWVDGQYALSRPELGLSNWQHGRLFARGGVLSGDGVFTVRARMRQSDVRLRR